MDFVLIVDGVEGRVPTDEILTDVKVGTHPCNHGNRFSFLRVSGKPILVSKERETRW